MQTITNTKNNKIWSAQAASDYLRKHDLASSIEIAGLSLRKDRESEFILITGDSGSGNALYLQEKCITKLSLGIKVTVIDLGNSFKHICQLLGGTMISFGKDSNISLNPFGKLSSIKGDIVDGNIITEAELKRDAVIYAKNIVCAMARGGTQHLEALIERAIFEAIECYGKNLNITKISEMLKKGDSLEVKKLSESLFTYTEKGLHGHFFDKESNINFDNDFTVIEFQDTAQDPHLISVLTSVIGMEYFLSSNWK